MSGQVLVHDVEPRAELQEEGRGPGKEHVGKPRAMLPHDDLRLTKETNLWQGGAPASTEMCSTEEGARVSCPVEL